MYYASVVAIVLFQTFAQLTEPVHAPFLARSPSKFQFPVITFLQRNLSLFEAHKVPPSAVQAYFIIEQSLVVVLVIPGFCSPILFINL